MLLPLELGFSKVGEKTAGGEEERSHDEARVLGSKATTRKVKNATQTARAQAALPPWPCKHGKAVPSAETLIAGRLRQTLVAGVSRQDRAQLLRTLLLFGFVVGIIAYDAMPMILDGWSYAMLAMVQKKRIVCDIGEFRIRC